jgi:RHS repeat-associated protein
MQYQITGHLGNLAVLFSDANNDGHITSESEASDPDEIEVLQRQFYYPFGMDMDGTWLRVKPYEDRYRYNHKELTKGLGWYAYGARYYDAAIGRFAGVDPLADAPANIEWSPYAYVWNNPLRYVDPDGRQGEDWVQRNDGSIYWDDNATSQATTKAGEIYLGYDFSTVSSMGLQTNYNNDATFDHYSTDGNTLPEVTVTGKDPSRASTVYKMLWEWDQGTGPRNRTFNNNSVSYSFQDARRVNEARDLWYRKASGSSNYLNTSVTGYRGTFGLADLLWYAGTDPVEQFVGTYRIQSIIPDQNDNLIFTLTNRTSMKSLLYGKGPEWERSSFRLNGNTYQTYIFTEPIDFNRIK